VHYSVVALLAMAAPALADSLVLDEHQLVVALSTEFDLSGDQVENAIAIAPDVWWGITPRWTIGLIHSNRSLDRIDAGASLCVHECDQLYHDVGLDVRYAAIAGVLAPRVRFVMRQLADPAKPALTLGALARWSRGRWSITGDPYVQLGLANRDRGNRSGVVLPVWFAVTPAHWSVALHTGYFTDVAVWRDGYHIPLGLDASAHATDSILVGAEFGFSSLLGPQNNSKERVLLVTLTFGSAAPARASRGSAAAASPASRD
jgi:hypothetical protein